MAPAWDNLGALDRWVEDGVPPKAQIAADRTKSPTRGRTRPLCEFPSWPKYFGQGDINDAASYHCVKE
ncbi:tannase/feruloyl esterase family alpha/beta hydrolase (plasmid) [Rhizobium lusitanum]|uniref:tannase/feruloyl esterase family alpha/beta hydrolase n=1 Tax=Rhizobium lusitanum TaxID=293958 RepID=UPI00160F08EF|nr:tannase/feruloyl esterase family alpha/beta hydrolase [Rhizobium lusitanum]QND44383.1 tannase/feruloyl esterase family alpha/beta hydrolase [Rhizobium lusitanum]